jgi:hypothetical protein
MRAPLCPTLMPSNAIVTRLKLEHFNNGQGRSVPHATQIQFRTKLRFSKPEGQRPRPIRPSRHHFSSARAVSTKSLVPARQVIAPL